MGKGTYSSNKWAIFYGAVLLALIFSYASMAGTWLDEFFQLDFANTGGDVSTWIWNKLLFDTHPPLFNMLSAPVAAVAQDDVVAARLISAGLAVIVLTAGLFRLAQYDRALSVWMVAFWFLCIGSYGATGFQDAATNFRSYVWIIAIMALQIAVLAVVCVSERDLEPKSNHGLAALVFTVSVLAFLLHHLNTGVAGLVALATIGMAWKRGLKNWALISLSGAILGGLCWLATLAIQIPNVSSFMDFIWLDHIKRSRASSFLGTPMKAAFSNIIGLGAFGLLVVQRRKLDRLPLVALGVLAVASGVLFLIDLVQPVVVDRYLVSFGLLVAAAVATGAAAFWHNHFFRHAFLLCAVLMAAYRFVARPPDLRWDRQAMEIGKIVQACPTTQVFAASGTLFRPDRGMKTAQVGEPIFAIAYNYLGKSYGFKPVLLVEGQRKIAAPGACPVILWLEHSDTKEVLSAKTVLREAGLDVPADSKMLLKRSGGTLQVTVEHGQVAQ